MFVVRRANVKEKIKKRGAKLNGIKLRVWEDMKRPENGS